jgi:voltage-gated potassium channel
MSLRNKVHSLLDPKPPGSLGSKAVEAVVVTLILLSVTAIVVETVPGMSEPYGLWFHWIERGTLTVFAAEYVLRIWSCTADPTYSHPIGGRLRFAMRPLLVIDLISMLPLLITGNGLPIIMRGLRMLRLLRLLKLTRYSTGLQTFGRVLKRCAPELLSTLFVMMVMLVFSSSLMFLLERDANPKFGSIPDAMWWGIATFTTVGYGDVTPITPLGRLLGGCVAILGIAMFAIPAGVLGAAFSQELTKRNKHQNDGN